MTGAQRAEEDEEMKDLTQTWAALLESMDPMQ